MLICIGVFVFYAVETMDKYIVFCEFNFFQIYASDFRSLDKAE